MDAPSLEPLTSPLLRRALAEARLSVTEYLADGAYPYARAEKDEVERRVAGLVADLRDGSLDAETVTRYCRCMFPPDEIARAREDGRLSRLLGFAALQVELDDALYALEDRALEPPAPEDLVFTAHPDLLEALDPRDRLLRLTPELVAHERVGNEAIVAWKGDALFPHPHLADKRELVWELVELAADPSLVVSVAIHPFRSTPLNDLLERLLHDYWSGIQLKQENLDSLDAHDVGVPTFHAAIDRAPMHDFFFPLIGTWFDWAARKDDSADPVKRLYIREARPAADRDGEPLVAALNRELHAERDTSRRRFLHVDGKLRRYPAETYGPSPQQPYADFGPHSHSRKLWRVDGELSDERWCRLVGLWFRGNELIEEHFKTAFLGFPSST